MQEDPRKAEELEQEEVEEIPEEEEGEEGEDYEDEEEEEVVHHSKPKKATPTRAGASLVDFFEASLSASAARLNLTKGQKSAASPTQKRGTPSRNGALASYERQRQQKVAPRSRPHHRQEAQHYANEDYEEEDYEEEEEEEDVFEEEMRPTKRRTLYQAPPPTQHQWQPPVPSYDPYYASQWYQRPSPYWNAQPTQHPYQAFPYMPQPQQPPQPQYQPPNSASYTSDETKAYYYGLAMGLYQAATLIYQQRVCAPETAPVTYQHYQEQDDEELATERRKRPRSKSNTQGAAATPQTGQSKLRSTNKSVRRGQ